MWTSCGHLTNVPLVTSSTASAVIQHVVTVRHVWCLVTMFTWMQMNSWKTLKGKKNHSWTNVNVIGTECDRKQLGKIPRVLWAARMKTNRMTNEIKTLQMVRNSVSDTKSSWEVPAAGTTSFNRQKLPTSRGGATVQSHLVKKLFRELTSRRPFSSELFIFHNLSGPLETTCSPTSFKHWSRTYCFVPVWWLSSHSHRYSVWPPQPRTSRTRATAAN